MTKPDKIGFHYGGRSSHPGLSKIPARVRGPGSDIINLGITIGQKLGAGRFLIPSAGGGSHVVYQNLHVLFNTSKGSKYKAYCMKCNPL